MERLYVCGCYYHFGDGGETKGYMGEGTETYNWCLRDIDEAYVLEGKPALDRALHMMAEWYGSVGGPKFKWRLFVEEVRHAQ